MNNNKISKIPKKKKKIPKKKSKIIQKKDKKNIPNKKNNHNIQVTKIIERMKERHYYF